MFVRQLPSTKTFILSPRRCPHAATHSSHCSIKPSMALMHGGRGVQDEYSLVEALKAGAITKPVVAWVSGTCATLFKSEVQFGHAGAKSGGALESAQVCHVH